MARALAAVTRDLASTLERLLGYGRVRYPERIADVEMDGRTTLALPYAPVGERSWRSRQKAKNTTPLSRVHAQEIEPSMAVEGAATREVVEAYVERFLPFALRPGLGS